MNEFKTEILEITPKMAAKMLSRNIKNRPLSKITIDDYANSMINDEWQLTPQGISFNQYNELIDGQHRLNAIVKADKVVKMTVFYNVPQENFKVIDTGRARTSKDIFAIEGIKYPMEISAGLKKYYIYSTTNNVFANNYRKKISNTLILEMYNEHSAIINNEVVTAGTYYKKLPKFYSKSEILGTILYLHLTKKHSIETIHGFFNQLYFGRCITYTMIENLRERLILSSMMQSKKIYPAEKVILLKKVWNAYLKGGKTIFKLTAEYDEKIGIDFI